MHTPTLYVLRPPEARHARFMGLYAQSIAAQRAFDTTKPSAYATVQALEPIPLENGQHLPAGSHIVVARAWLNPVSRVAIGVLQ